MSKRTEPRNKIDRRLGSTFGENLNLLSIEENWPWATWLKKKKLSDYGVQLFAKQKLKGYYGNVSEKQFRKYYEKAFKEEG